jgi:hypothetical protein
MLAKKVPFQAQGQANKSLHLTAYAAFNQPSLASVGGF